MEINSNNLYEIIDALDIAPVKVGDVIVGSGEKMWIIPDKQSVYIDHPLAGFVFLGTSSRNWKPLQPHGFIEAMVNVAKDYNTVVSKGVSIKNGTSICLEVPIPSSKFQQFGDDYDVSLVGHLSNVPGEGMNFRLNTTRLVCQNGAMSRLAVGNRVVLSHVQDLSKTLQAVTNAVQMSVSQVQKVMNLAKSSKVTPEQAHKQFLQLFQSKEQKEAGQIPYGVQVCDRLFNEDLIGMETVGKGNGLTVINALTEFQSHYVQHQNAETATQATVFSHADRLAKLYAPYLKQIRGNKQGVAVRAF